MRGAVDCHQRSHRARTGINGGYNASGQGFSANLKVVDIGECRPRNKRAGPASFSNQVVWEHLEPLGVGVVFSHPSLAHARPGFLNARSRVRSQNETTPGVPRTRVWSWSRFRRYFQSLPGCATPKISTGLKHARKRSPQNRHKVRSSLAQIGGPQSPISNALKFEVDLI